MPDDPGTARPGPESPEALSRPVPLKLLFVEDSEPDVTLLAFRLRKAGYALTYERVESAASLEEALRHGPWDAVLSDFSIPGFGGLQALEVLRKHDPDLPFIVVSGSIGEARAVEAMRAGASDYVM